MRPKNSYILRFDSREVAESCFCYFPEKASYSGYTIIISGPTVAEWMIYRQILCLLKKQKIDIIVNSF